MNDRIPLADLTADQLDALQARAADAETWRHKAVQRALTISRLTGALTAVTEMAHEEVTPQTGWGDGYRAALADLHDVLDTFQPTEQTTSHADADKVVTIPVLSPEECAAIDAERQRADQAEARVRTLEHVAAGNKRHVQHVVPELEKAEAALERVRQLHRESCPLALGTLGVGFMCSMCEALDEPPARVVGHATIGVQVEAATEATEEQQ